MSFSIGIDPLTNNDFRIKDGKFVLKTGDDAIIDRIYTSLNIEKGEWFLNINDGLSLFGEDGIFSGKKGADEISALISAVILSDPDVDYIETFELSEDDEERLFTATVSCKLKSGSTVTLEV